MKDRVPYFVYFNTAVQKNILLGPSPIRFLSDVSNKSTSKLGIEQLKIKIESASKNFRCKLRKLVGLPFLSLLGITSKFPSVLPHFELRTLAFH